MIRALSFIGNLSNKTKIADLGCGTGAQTMVLAQNTEATITALDLYAGSIDKLNATAGKLGLQNRVKWRDIIEVQRTNTQKVIESKEEQGGVCNAQI
ncbi:hypothetical protein OBV_44280 [Oscillibacter valericigenes Sjm18-20]|nr:hypothetical protein OBV_44280 [Oscillibacter valericigenes Sjm18-20]